MHEIVTLQFGSQANYVGTHFWNTQESYFTYEGQGESPVNHDIHFREGIGTGGSATFTPRTVIYDFKENFGSLRRINELYEQVERDETPQAQLWDGSVISQNVPQVNINTYQRSLNAGKETPALTKADVRFWSDFNRVFYHPRSIVQIYETEVNIEQRAFVEWSTGEELFASLDREEDLIDRDVRHFVEECDQMQGFQILSETDTAWAGFSSRFLERLRDDFGKLSIWAYGVGSPENSTARRALKLINQARMLCDFSEQASMYVPAIGSPTNLPSYVSLDRTHPWHTSAIQAAGFETMLLPSRLKPLGEGRSAPLDHLALELTGEHDHRIAELSFEVGDYTFHSSNTNGHSHGNTDDQEHQSSYPVCQLFAGQDASAETSRDAHAFSRMVSRRGKWQDQSSEGSENEMNSRNFTQYSTDLRMPLPDSFPHIFSTAGQPNEPISVQAQLKVTPGIGSWAKSLEQATRLRMSYHEREEFSNQLRSIGDSYTSGFDGSDGSDDYGSDD